MASSLGATQNNAADMQLMLGQYIAFFERVKNLLNWTHPYKTSLVLVGTFVSIVLCRIAPFRYGAIAPPLASPLLPQN